MALFRSVAAQLKSPSCLSPFSVRPRPRSSPDLAMEDQKAPINDSELPQNSEESEEDACSCPSTSTTFSTLLKKLTIGFVERLFASEADLPVKSFERFRTPFSALKRPTDWRMELVSVSNENKSFHKLGDRCLHLFERFQVHCEHFEISLPRSTDWAAVLPASFRVQRHFECHDAHQNVLRFLHSGLCEVDLVTYAPPGYCASLRHVLQRIPKVRRLSLVVHSFTDSKNWPEVLLWWLQGYSPPLEYLHLAFATKSSPMHFRLSEFVAVLRRHLPSCKTLWLHIVDSRRRHFHNITAGHPGIIVTSPLTSDF